MSRILQSPRNFWRELPVAGAGLLVDADDYYRAFYAAGQTAEHYILLAGWQFDSDACLLRGHEAEGAPLPVALLEYLKALCERNKNLAIYILAWDFHAVFALEREWMQQLRFNWSTNEQLTFLFDSTHVDQGSHHQKFVVIDGQLSFLGGIDLCDHRWDDRGHKDPNPLRLSRGEPHKPFHDIQTYMVGPQVAGALTELFVSRWQAAGGKPLSLAENGHVLSRYEPVGAVPLAVSRVALSRTDPHGAPTQTKDCREICDLHLDALASATRLVYIETQYFSSREIGAALAKRLQVSEGPPLDVVIVLNMQAETLKEEVAVGLAQAQVIAELRKSAEGTQHRLGIYYTVPDTDSAEPARATYIHSKLMIIDDRFLTVGSANLTNRSMGVDTELNLSVETEDATDALGCSIVQARESLIAEHLGLSSATAHPAGGLVTILDEQARRHEGRLRLHPSPTANELAALDVIEPQQLPFDPAGIEDHEHRRSIFVGGLSALWKRLAG